MALSSPCCANTQSCSLVIDQSCLEVKSLRQKEAAFLLLGIAALGAALGFNAMLQQGTSIVGYMAIPIVVIPALTFVAAKVHKAK